MKKLIFWGIGALVIILLGTALWIYGCAEQVREDAPEILKIVSRPLPLDSTEVSPSEPLTVTLNFTIDHREITKDNLFAEYVEYGSAHTAGTPDLSFATLSWSSDSKTLTVSGIRGWSELVEYAGPKRVHIVAKADKFKDVYGNKLKSTVFWKYTLKQISAPTSSSSTSTTAPSRVTSTYTTAPSLATSTSTTAPSLATSTSTTAPSLATTTTSFPTTTSTTPTTTTTLSGQFDIEIVSDPNPDPWVAASLNSIGIDSNESAHISYEDNNNGYLRYATNKTGSWQNETIDNSWNIGYENSIAIDKNDNNKVHISYMDPFDSDNLLYAYGQAGSFSTEIIENDASWWLAQFNSIAVDNNSVVHIAYLYNDNTDDKLKYASGEAGSWSLSTLESMGLVGTDISIALDSNNYPHISYYESTNDDLKYTYRDASGWHTSTVASTDDVGRTNSIAVDSNNYPHISYYDATGDDLEYAYEDAGGWHYETVTSEGDVGSYNSIAVDNNDYVNISCFEDASPDLLLWSTNRSGSWVTRTITNEVWRYNSIAVGSDNRVHISFSDGNGYLYYAEEQ